MVEITRVAIDTSKSVFTIHAVDARDRPVLRRNLRRQDVAGFFARCRCYGGCPSGAELVGCGCEANTQQLGAPDGQP